VLVLDAPTTGEWKKRISAKLLGRRNTSRYDFHFPPPGRASGDRQEDLWWPRRSPYETDGAEEGGVAIEDPAFPASMG